MLRRIVLWAAALVALATVVAGATPVLLGWTAAPVYGRQVAETALAEARASAARAWAPELLSRAETTMRLNLAEERMQANRLLPLRDFRVVRDGFGRVEQESRTAIEEGARRAARAKAEAQDELERAESTLVAAREVVDAAGSQTALRSRLAHARIVCDEARLRFADGDYPYARERAGLAAAEAREVVGRATAMMGRYVDAAEVARWQRWIEETIRWSRQTGEPAIVVSKDDHRLTLYLEGRAVDVYPADLGLNNLTGKVSAGDHATPEGRYKITSKRGPGQTAYYKALMLDYPNRDDRRRFEELRRNGQVPRGAGPGSLIEIHGEGGRTRDWTRGCVALSNEHMDQLFARVRVGTPVTIVGGRGEGGTFSNLVRGYAMTHHAGDDATVD